MENRGRAPGSPDFGMLLRHYRLSAGLSQEVLAERAQMSVNGVSALERGYRRTPQRETLSLLVGALALNDEQREEFEAAAARSVLLGRGASVTVGPLGGRRKPRPASGADQLRWARSGARRDCHARSRASNGHAHGDRRHR